MIVFYFFFFLPFFLPDLRWPCVRHLHCHFCRGLWAAATAAAATAADVARGESPSPVPLQGASEASITTAVPLKDDF